MRRPAVKGRALIDAVGFVRERHGQRGVDAVVDVLDAQAREILRGTLLANDWYPLDVLTSFTAAGVRLYNGGDEDVLVDRSERVVEAQLGGIYRVFIRLGSPEFILKRLGTISQTYFQGIDIAPQLDGERRAVVRYTGFSPQHRIMEPVIVGFYRKALQLSGAKDVTVRIMTPISAAKGFLEIEVTWS